MNNQQQSSVMNSGVSTGHGNLQNGGIPHQRGGQQLNYPQLQQANALAQMSHYQTQQQQPLLLSGAYQKLKKQQHNSIDVISGEKGPQYVVSNGAIGLSTQNGNSQPITGSSSLGAVENRQIPQYQHHMQQYQDSQPKQQQRHLYPQQQQQQQVSSTQHQHIHQMHQPVQQHQMIQHQLHQHSLTSSTNDSSGFQQARHLHVEQQQHSRGQRQHHNFRHHNHKQQHQIQPKHILQNPLHAKNVVASNQQSTPVESQEPPLIIDTFTPNGQDSDSNSGADQAQVEEKSPNSEDTRSNATSEASEDQSLANTKEKTPMCLINELARFNKISHQYTLVDEQGPAHKKIFYVKLKLGDEEYSASGESIKKAQHAAAAIALTETGHPHPVPKQPRHNANENITPTVELNALAMKRGEATTYKAIEPQQPPYYPQPGIDFRGLYNPRYHQFMRASRDPRYRGGGVLWPLRYHYPRMNRAFYVSLRVGHREFIGDGPTRQAARHNAAQKALRILKSLPIQQPTEASKDSKCEDVEVTELEVEEEEVETPEVNNNDGLKSEISLVHEIALRRNMLVTFEVIRETGPPHMKTFVTRCTVADKVSEGEGNSKKTSKKRAAELMLEELKSLPPTSAPTCGPKPRGKVQINKKKNRNLIKSELQQQKADPNYGVGINPISRLIQIMQATKKKEPVYTLVSERGLPRRREFVMQVEVEDKTCTGTGPNKKLAKRAAAEAMLLELGYTKPSPQPTKSSIKNSSSGEGAHSNGDKKVHFVGDPEDGNERDKIASSANSLQSSVSAPSAVQHHQRVPGLLHLPPSTSARPTFTSASLNGPVQSQPKEQLVNLASILKPSLRPEIQLRELCKAMDMELEIDDFTKKRPSGTEHITRITVDKEPRQQSFHGSSTTLESSRDMAALDALKMLLARVKELHPGGDGPQVKKELLTRPSLSFKKDTK